MNEPCVCTDGPYAHNQEDNHCEVPGCWCVSYRPESTTNWRCHDLETRSGLGLWTDSERAAGTADTTT